MINLVEKIKSIKIKSATIGYLGFSVELGMDNIKRITLENLKELYIMRNALSYFYYLYQHKSWDIINSGEDENALIIGLHEEAVNTYKKISDLLIDSGYFMILTSEQRENIMESLDYVYMTEAYLDSNADNDLSDDEVLPIIVGLIDLFEEIVEQINSAEKILVKS